MTNKYIKNSSGYCYKICGDKKTRISLEEYKKKTKKIGGIPQFLSRSQSMPARIHSSNTLRDIESPRKVSFCKEKCKNNRSINCMIGCMRI